MNIDFGRFIGIFITIPLIVIGLAAAFNLILAIIAQACWNYFCGALHLPTLGYWQMWCLLFFLSIVASIFRNNVSVKNND